MDPVIWSLVSKFRTNSDNYNFGGQLTPYLGKFNIERLDLDNWWNAYCDSVVKSQGKYVYGLGEKPQEIVPLLVDIDLDTKYEEDIHGKIEDNKCFEKLYTFEEVKIIVKTYQKVIKEISKQWKPSNSICFLLEKEGPYIKDKKLKGGFHLHFPKLWIRNCDHDIHILPRVTNYINEDHANLFSSLGHSDKEAGSFIDPKVCSKHWLLYGSGKAVESGVYKVTTAFDHECNEISLEEALSNYKLLDARSKEIQLTSQNIRYYLPRILSIHPANKPVLELKTNLECAVKMAIATAEERAVHNQSENINDDVIGMRELMNFISPTRADFYDTWFEMACVCYCIGDGCQEALDIFIDFSSKTSRDNYDETKCVYLWQKLINSHKYSLGTLHHYAKIDNPLKYEEWRKQKRGNSTFMRILTSYSHYTIAKELEKLFKNTFVSTVNNDKVFWYEYKNHGWELTEKGLALRSKISTDLVLIAENDIRNIHKYLQEEPDDDKSKEIKLLRKLITNLETSSYKSNVMNEAIEIFNKPKFIKMLDADINLLRFTNGVMDLKNLVFRPGNPEDYVSMSTNYDFQEYSESDPDYIEVLNFLEKVFPDEDLRTYFIEYCASLLRGGNTRKVFLNMTGSGNNAKSIVIMLIEQTLGEYMIKFPTSLIIGKRTQSSSASPELARSQGVRFAVVQEPDKKDIINDGIIKELTGNDSFFARGLFKDGGEIKPMFKLGLICNKLLRLSGGDPAMWARIDVLPFESKFLADPKEVPETVEEQFRLKIFPQDPCFADKLPKLKKPFMYLLFKTFKEVRRRGHTPKPAKVLIATDEYKRANDVILQYITERVKIDHGKSLSVQEIYVDFCEWFKATFNQLKPPNRNELTEELSTRWGPPNDSFRWKNIRLKTTRDEIAEGKAFVYDEETEADETDNLEVDLSEEKEDKSEENNNDNKEKKLEIKEEVKVQQITENSKNEQSVSPKSINAKIVMKTELNQSGNQSSEETYESDVSETGYSSSDSTNGDNLSDGEHRYKKVERLLKKKYRVVKK